MDDLPAFSGAARHRASPGGGELLKPEFLAILDDPSGIEAEAIRGLRLRLSVHLNEGCKALTLCAASVGCGCSTIAANLAVALSQTGMKVALVDADLRNPRIGRIFGISETSEGLADYLASDEYQLDELLWREISPHLAVLPAGDVAANSHELLSGQKFPQLLGHLVREFDVVLFDTPPANLRSDGQRVATLTGHSLIVARKDQSFASDVATLAKLLEANRSKVVGSVMMDF